MDVWTFGYLDFGMIPIICL